MDRFWILVTGLVLLALFLISVSDDSTDFSVRSLSSECTYFTENFQKVSVEESSLRFQGAFGQYKSISMLDYSFKDNRRNLRLEIDVKEGGKERFHCRKRVLYDFETSPLDSGRYTVSVVHDGSKVYGNVITVD